MSVTRDDWLRALTEAGLEASEDDQAAITIRDFCAMFDVSHTTAAQRLQKLVAAGRAIETTKRGVSAYGRRVNYRAFRLLSPA